LLSVALKMLVLLIFLYVAQEHMSHISSIATFLLCTITLCVNY
jgi:hypothetical protein